MKSGLRTMGLSLCVLTFLLFDSTKAYADLEALLVQTISTKFNSGCSNGSLNPFNCPNPNFFAPPTDLGVEPPGMYTFEVLSINHGGANGVIYSGDEQAGTAFRIPNEPGRIITFNHLFGHIVLFDAFPFGNDPEASTVVILFRGVPACQARVNQAVDNVDIDNDGFVDLVANRNTVVRIVGCGTDPTTIHASFVSNAGTTNFMTNGLVNGDETDFFFTPSSAADLGKGTISATDSAGNQLGAQLPVDVKQVRAIKYAFFKVDYLAPVPDFASTVANSIDYLQAVYPLDPSTFSVQVVPNYLPGLLPAAGSYLPVPLGAWVDSWNIWLQKKLLGADRAVAIVPQYWFTYHGLGGGTFGQTFGAIPVAFVTDDYPVVTAHELGHTYLGEVEFPSLAAAETNGFWVQVPKAVPNSLDYMLEGHLPGVPGSFVPDPVLPSDDLRSSPKGTERWSSPTDFKRLFQKFLVPPPLDPQTLLLTGAIDSNGNVTLGPLYQAASSADEPAGGPFAVQLLDFSGNLVTEVPFGADLTVYDLDPSVTLDSAPFALAVAFPGNVAQVQVTHSSQVVSHVNIASKLLSDAISSLPDAGFRREAAEHKEELLEEVGHLDQEIAEKDLKSAIRELAELRRKLRHELREDHTVDSPLQFTKSQILALVDSQVQRLSAQIPRDDGR